MWMHTLPGATKEVKATYALSHPINLKTGSTYTFVFEKQSGVESLLNYSLIAPPGYRWAESNSRLFTYSNDDLPSRLTLMLTLQKESQ
jgi:hypothetical protein